MHQDLMPSDRDHEGKMARADLFKLAQYSFKLFKMLDDNQQLDGWVQAKITKAADYIASVYHYLEYEMKFSDYGQKLENSDVYVESIRTAYTNKLMEAKKKMDKLKASLDKKEKEMKEGFDEMEKYLKDKKGPQPKGGAGKKEGSKYGGSKQKDDEDKDKDVKEGFEEMQKYLDKKRGPQPSGGSGIKKGSRYGGSKQADDKEEDEDEGKKKNTKVKEASKPDYLDFDKDGNKKEPMKKALKDKKVKEVVSDSGPKGQPVQQITTSIIDPKTKKPVKMTPYDIKKDTKGGLSVGFGEGSGKCNESAKGKMCPVHGMKECSGMYEAAKPSAGMSKDKKSALVKKAKKGGDIGKPGKNFDKVAAAAKKGGAKDPKAVAAAAMWKNAAKKESVEPTPVAIQESVEVARLKELTKKLLG